MSNIPQELLGQPGSRSAAGNFVDLFKRISQPPPPGASNVTRGQPENYTPVGQIFGGYGSVNPPPPLSMSQIAQENNFGQPTANVIDPQANDLKRLSTTRLGQAAKLFSKFGGAGLLG